MSSTQQLLLGEGAGGSIPVYIEEVFSTFLYTGTGSAQFIGNGIDFSTKGGMLWLKARNDTRNNWLYDTNRGYEYGLRSDLDFAQSFTSDALTGFYNDGFGIGTSGNINTSGNTLVSWSFRQQPKFFDVVTYTGNGSSQTIAHSLGSAPGSIFVKRTDVAANWIVYHRGLSSPNGIHLKLNSTASQDGNNDMVNGTSSTTFSVGSEVAVNSSGSTYVAYLFAHNAGGFGATGTDNVISCASLTTDGSGNATVDLGYEPQWVLIKQSNETGQNWILQDSVRGMFATGNDGRILNPNTTAAETTAGGPILLTSTGFKINAYVTGATIVYIAIRRGPMKTPTVGTSVFSPIARTGTGATAVITAPNFVVDSAWIQQRQPSGWQASKVFNRLRGPNFLLYTNTSSAEVNAAVNTLNSFASNVGFTLGNDQNGYSVNMSASAQTYINYAFSRAPGFFDTVYYTGVGGTASFSHNLGVAPELMFVKSRSGTTGGLVYNKTITESKYLKLFFEGESTSGAVSDTGGFAGVEPTSSVFTVGFYSNVNTSGATYVAWLFATCPGVSKVGTYAGSDSAVQVDCGFTTGVRFVLIKRTDGTGGWVVYDSARGIVAGDDPYLEWNSEAAETDGTDYVDSYSAGFEVSAAAPGSLNGINRTFIFLAIA